LTKSSFIRCLRILDRSDRTKLVIVILVQIGLSLLDLLGVATIGILGALTVNGIQSRKPAGAVSQALDILGIENSNFRRQRHILELPLA